MKARKTYVLIPVMPTPNGPLHLGHIAGPFLKMDMLARHLRRNGNTVALVSATDPYETHVLPRADEQNKPVEQICAENHRAIHRCLQALDIRYDAFIDPLASPYRARLNGITREVLDDLHAQGRLHARNEPVHISRRTGRMLVGSRIVGTCPCCGVEMGGYHCEGCGMEVSPRDLIAPRAEPADDTVEVEARASVFVDADLPALQLRMLEARVPADVRRIAERFMHAAGSAVRLSNPGEWGEIWPNTLATAPSVVFSYTALFMLSVLCGEAAREILALDHNPFDRCSDALIVTSFGFDNTVPFCVGVETLAQHSRRYRGFDRCLTNFFYTLDGRKFSTSRQHCIWADQAVRELGVASDVLRYFLAKTSPESGPSDFSRDGFDAFRRAIEPRLAQMKAAVESGTGGDAAVPYADTLARLVADMDAAFDVDHFSLRAATRCIDQWLALPWQPAHAAAYVRGFCMLAYPVMPELASTLWSQLGHEGLPRYLAATELEEAA
ncbi:methionine--tRNA ligase [Ralstonia pseudosolanacearum]|uniref:methionine--tRNA ligase n=1 Tax=Ralstonia pseudosolanacearum TaxID=1310165 RepID=UPI00048A4F0E|nr:methionine--tRNA ligase [Ralstonia pseudosolanacearum]